MKVVKCSIVVEDFASIVRVELEDGSKVDAFKFYRDELSFTPKQFIGKTVEECREIHYKADLAYLKSN
jgi:hypothetical protein